MEWEGLNCSQLIREDSSCSHMIEDITGRELPYEVDQAPFWFREAPQLLPHDEQELPLDEDITGRVLPPQTECLPPTSYCHCPTYLNQTLYTVHTLLHYKNLVRG